MATTAEPLALRPVARWDALAERVDAILGPLHDDDEDDVDFEWECFLEAHPELDDLDGHDA